MCFVQWGTYRRLDAQVPLTIHSAAGNLFLGTLSYWPVAMRNFSAPVSVTPSWLLNVWVPLVGTVGVGFSAHAPIGGGTETSVVFTRDGSGPTLGAPPLPGHTAQLVSARRGAALAGGLLDPLTLSTKPLKRAGAAREW